MTRSALAAMALLLIGAARAEAAVYTFIPTGIGPTTSPLVTIDQAAFTIAISDAQVQSGFFNYDYRFRYFEAGNPPQIVYRPVATGDVQALQSFQGDLGRISFGSGGGPSGSGSDYFRVNLAFSSSGQITTGALSYGDDAYGIDVAGSGTTFNGLLSIGSIPQVSVTGIFAGGLSSVPEPTTLGILGASLALMAARRRRCHSAAAGSLPS